MRRPLAVALWTSAALVPGGVFFAITGMTAELVIVTAAGLAFIAMSLLPEAADETTKERYADHRTRPGPRPSRS